MLTTLLHMKTALTNQHNFRKFASLLLSLALILGAFPFEVHAQWDAGRPLPRSGANFGTRGAGIPSLDERGGSEDLNGATEEQGREKASSTKVDKRSKKRRSNLRRASKDEQKNAPLSKIEQRAEDVGSSTKALKNTDRTTTRENGTTTMEYRDKGSGEVVATIKVNGLDENGKTNDLSQVTGSITVEGGKDGKQITISDKVDRGGRAKTKFNLAAGTKYQNNFTGASLAQNRGTTAKMDGANFKAENFSGTKRQRNRKAAANRKAVHRLSPGSSVAERKVLNAKMDGAQAGDTLTLTVSKGTTQTNIPKVTISVEKAAPAQAKDGDAGVGGGHDTTGQMPGEKGPETNTESGKQQRSDGPTLSKPQTKVLKNALQGIQGSLKGKKGGKKVVKAIGNALNVLKSDGKNPPSKKEVMHALNKVKAAADNSNLAPKQAGYVGAGINSAIKLIQPSKTEQSARVKPLKKILKAVKASLKLMPIGRGVRRDMKTLIKQARTIIRKNPTMTKKLKRVLNKIKKAAIRSLPQDKGPAVVGLIDIALALIKPDKSPASGSGNEGSTQKPGNNDQGQRASTPDNTGKAPAQSPKTQAKAFNKAIKKIVRGVKKFAQGVVQLFKSIVSSPAQATDQKTTPKPEAPGTTPKISPNSSQPPVPA